MSLIGTTYYYLIGTNEPDCLTLPSALHAPSSILGQTSCLNALKTLVRFEMYLPKLLFFTYYVLFLENIYTSTMSRFPLRYADLLVLQFNSLEIERGALEVQIFLTSPLESSCTTYIHIVECRKKCWKGGVVLEEF